MFGTVVDCGWSHAWIGTGAPVDPGVDDGTSVGRIGSSWCWLFHGAFAYPGSDEFHGALKYPGPAGCGFHLGRSRQPCHGCVSTSCDWACAAGANPGGCCSMFAMLRLVNKARLLLKPTRNAKSRWTRMSDFRMRMRMMTSLVMDGLVQPVYT